MRVARGIVLPADTAAQGGDFGRIHQPAIAVSATSMKAPCGTMPGFT